MTLAVVPVLVGPLQTLLALLPAILVALGTLLATLLTPRGMLRVLRFLWHQKLFSTLVLAMILCAYQGWPLRVFSGHRGRSGRAFEMGAGNWPMFRGDLGRRGARLDGEAVPDGGDWTAAGEEEPESVYASVAVVGRQIIYATAGGIGPFSPAGRGAIVCVDAVTGDVEWRYAPHDFRATFSSPVVAEGHVVCGEGLHLVQDARVTCLDLRGQRQWEFRTKSHVEATACIADGRVFVAAGDDGFYALSLTDVRDGQPAILWHLPGDEFPDCESSPVVAWGDVFFGLGEGGQAICAVDAATGVVRWRVETPFPVFGPATVLGTQDNDRRIVVGLGRGNFVQSADDLRTAELSKLREEGATVAELAEAHARLAPAGEIRCLDATTGATRWHCPLPETILGAIAVWDDELYAACRDGTLYCVTDQGEQRRQWSAREPLVSSPAVTEEWLFVTTLSGRLYCLDRRTFELQWDVATGSGAPSYSSPTWAHHRLFVGTADQGLRCLRATRGSETPLWNRGRAGGALDRHPLPDAAAVLWRADPEIEGDEPREVQPLAALPDGLIAALAIPLANTSVVTSWRIQDVESPGERVAWQTEVEGRVVLPPVIVGDQVLLGLVDTPEPRPSLAVVGLDRSRGVELWRTAVEGEVPIAWTAGHGQVVLLVENVVHALRATDGRRQWQRAIAGEGGGALALTEDLVLALSGSEWSILDALSGALLRHAPLPGVALTGENDLAVLTVHQDAMQLVHRDGDALVLRTMPIVEEAERAVTRLPTMLTYINARLERSDFPPLRSEEKWIGLRGGELVMAAILSTGAEPSLESPGTDRSAAAVALESWCALDAGEMPATPLVAVAGRVYFLTDQGRLVCVGGAQP